MSKVSLVSSAHCCSRVQWLVLVSLDLSNNEGAGELYCTKLYYPITLPEVLLSQWHAKTCFLLSERLCLMLSQKPGQLSCLWARQTHQDTPAHASSSDKPTSLRGLGYHPWHRKEMFTSWMPFAPPWSDLEKKHSGDSGMGVCSCCSLTAVHGAAEGIGFRGAGQH